jgi:adenylate cyclase class 2
MAIEIEKKYQLTDELREQVISRLQKIGAIACGEVFEENTIYGGGVLDEKECALRLRRVGDTATLTYKERLPSPTGIKRQREDETRVEDAKAVADILDALGYKPALVYEKRRATWRLADAEVVIDELPFGWFLEIEGDEESIDRTEKLLGLAGATVVHETYPRLTSILGRRNGRLIEARFSAEALGS